MKKIILIASFITVCATRSFGQSLWFPQNSGITTSWSWTDVHFFDEKTGVVVGGGSNILRTTNGGDIWTVQFKDTTGDFFAYFYDLFFVNKNIGFAVGSGGTIVKTTDAGITWKQQVGGATTLYAVHFVDSAIGIAIGFPIGTIYRTVNGGDTWIPLPFIADGKVTVDPDHGFSDVFFWDPLKGILTTGNGRLFSTTTGGILWTEVDLTPMVGKCDGFSQIQFLTSDIGYIVGLDQEGALILHTDDGGVTWTKQLNPGGWKTFNSINFLDSMTGTVVGQDGIMVRTTNGGVTWLTESSGTTRSLNNVQMITSKIGVAVGEVNTIIRRIDNVSEISERNVDNAREMVSQNYPNPFSGNTEIDLVESGTFEVRDLLGRIVYRTEIMPAATSITIDANNLTNGLYQYSLSHGLDVQSRMMMVMK